MKRILKRIAIVTLTVFMCLTCIDLQVKAASPTDGEAYAVLVNDEDFIFFRSTEQYEEKAELQTVTDINGKSYTGIVFADVENGLYNSDIIGDYNYRVKKVYVAENTVIKPKECYYMFADMHSMTEFSAKGFDTSEAKNMGEMFAYCSSLTELDLSTFDTSSVTDMSFMFVHCYSLKKLNISSFDSGKVENMNGMFNGTNNLEEIVLGPKFTVWTESASLEHGMWSHEGLEIHSYDLPEQYAANAASWAGTWKNVIAQITSLELYDAVIPVDGGTGISWTWEPNDYKVNGSFIWKSSDTSIADFSDVTHGYIYGIKPGTVTVTATTTDGSNITAECTVRVVDGFGYAVLQDDGDLVFLRSKQEIYDDEGEITDLNGKTFKGKIFQYVDEDYFHGWNYDDENAPLVKRVYVAEGSTIYPTDMQNYFYNLVNMTEADLRGFDTTNTDRFAHLFADCKSLKKIDMSSFVISSEATYVYNLFGGCDSLEEIILGPEIHNLDELPMGIWTHESSGIKKTGEELGYEYPRNAKEWAGKWTRKLVTTTGLKFTQDEYEVEEGYVYGLELIVTPEDGTSPLVWESSDPEIVEIWSDGTIIGRKLGTATVTVKTEDGTVSAQCKVTVVERVERFDSYRVFGSNRYKTSLEIAKVFTQWSGLEKAECIILACGSNFADALAGSYLSAVKHAPIIIINDANLDLVKKNVKDLLAENGQIYILGGEVAVSATVEKEMKKITKNVKRLAGSNRYGTNLEILKEAGMDDADTILVATGGNFADSLSASATGLPMLLVKDSLSNEQKAFLEKNKGKKLVILGGEKAVVPAIEKALAKYGKVERLAGGTRFETSVKIAEKFFEDPWLAMVAYSNDYPDGLCGGPIGVIFGSPLILTRSDNLTAAKDYFKKYDIHEIIAFGGTTRLTDKDIKKLLNAKEVNYHEFEYKD